VKNFEEKTRNIERFCLVFIALLHIHTVRERLDGSRIESQWGARFSTPVQTSPGAHAASCEMAAGFVCWEKCDRGVVLKKEYRYNC
jgi:hypothetical protein